METILATFNKLHLFRRVIPAGSAPAGARRHSFRLEQPCNSGRAGISPPRLPQTKPSKRPTGPSALVAIGALLLGIAVAPQLKAQTTTCQDYTNNFQNGQTADASQVMANFEAIRSCANGSLAPLASPTFTGKVVIQPGGIVGYSDTAFSRATVNVTLLGNGSNGDATGTLGLAVLCLQGNVNLTQITAGQAQLGTGCTGNRGGSLYLTGLTAYGAISGASTVSFTGLGTGANADFLCLSGSGQVLIQASACTISSRRFKSNIQTWSDSAALADVMALEPVSFTLTDGGSNPDRNAARPQRGLIAEQVAAADPQLAVYEQDLQTPKSYRQEALIAALIGAVRAQQGEIAALRARIDGVESRVK